MQRPRTLDEWRDRLDENLPEWRWVMVNRRSMFTSYWQERTGQGRRWAFKVKEAADAVMNYEIEEILDRYRHGDFRESYTRALLKAYVMDELQDKEIFLPSRPGEGRLMSMTEFEDRLTEMLDPQES